MPRPRPDSPKEASPLPDPETLMTDEHTKDTDEREAPKARTLEVQQSISADPGTVWKALTDPEELKRWFPLDARVEPGGGGRVWLSWGPGAEGEAPIHIWDEPRRFGWTEEYPGEGSTPVRMMVDFHVEGKRGRTVVRLVQSGFGASADWDEMYDALKDGWTYFLFNLKHYLERHAGSPRRMVWARRKTDRTRDDQWSRLVGAGTLVEVEDLRPDADCRLVLDSAWAGTVLSSRTGYHLAATVPELNEGLLLVELEGAHVGVWLSTYGLEADRVAQLQRGMDERVRELLE